MLSRLSITVAGLWALAVVPAVFIYLHREMVQRGTNPFVISGDMTFLVYLTLGILLSALIILAGWIALLMIKRHFEDYLDF